LQLASLLARPLVLESGSQLVQLLAQPLVKQLGLLSLGPTSALKWALGWGPSVLQSELLLGQPWARPSLALTLGLMLVLQWSAQRLGQQ